MYTVTCWSIQSLVKSTSSHTHFYCKQKLVSWQPLSNLLEPCHCRDSNVCRVATREFDPKNQSWSFWSHNHETSMKMWKARAFSCFFVDATKTTLVTWTSTPKNESWSFWSHKHETSIKMWKRALIFGRECALVTWTSTKVATKQAFVCSRSVCVKRLT